MNIDIEKVFHGVYLSAIEKKSGIFLIKFIKAFDVINQKLLEIELSINLISTVSSSVYWQIPKCSVVSGNSLWKAGMNKNQT